MAKNKTEPMPPCRICGGETIPIAYGMPGGKLIKLAQKGKIKLGGCVVPSMDAMINPPGWCDDCEVETPIPEEWKNPVPEKFWE